MSTYNSKFSGAEIDEILGKAEELATLHETGQLGGGGSSDGFTIKKITFTDRSSMWAWLQNNHDKILKAVFSAAASPVPITFPLVNASYMSSSSTSLYDVTFSMLYPYSIGVSSMGFRVMCVCINENEVSTLLNPKDIQFINNGNTTENTFDMDTDELTTLPDAYWGQMSISMTMYYIESDDVTEL